MRRYDQQFKAPRLSEFPLSHAASAATFNIDGSKFSIPFALLQSTPSVFRNAGPYASPKTIRNLVRIVEQSATGLAAFDADFRLLVFGYSDTTEIACVETDQLDYSEATLENENTEQEVPFEEQEFPTVVVNFDLLVDAITLAEAIEAHTVVDVLYEEFCSVFYNVILTRAQVQKLFRSGQRMKAFLLKHIFGFKVTEKPPELFVEHLDAMIEAILHVPGLIDYVSSKLHQYSMFGWSAAIADPIRREIAEHRAAKAKEQQDRIGKYVTATDQEYESDPDRKGERPNQKQAKTGNADISAEEEPGGESLSREEASAPETPPDASQARDNGTDWGLGNLDLPTTQAGGTEAVNSNDESTITTNEPSTSGKSGVMTRSQRAAWAEEVARAPTPPAPSVETTMEPAQPEITEQTAADANTVPHPPTVPATQRLTTTLTPVPASIPSVPAPLASTAPTQTAPAAPVRPAPPSSPWTRGSRLRERPGNWKDKMKK